MSYLLVGAARVWTCTSRMHTSWCVLGCRLVLLETARGKCGWCAVQPAGSQAVMDAKKSGARGTDLGGDLGGG